MKAMRALLFFTLLFGCAYPLLITGIATFSYLDQASGSLVASNGKIVGSRLIGQKFEKEIYFWGRPSAIDWDPLHSGGSNLAPTSKTLQKEVEARRKKMAEAHEVAPGEVPAELLFASGSGLDPHISPATAYFQVARIAKARGLEEKILRSFIQQMIQPRSFHLLGEPTVNVLLLNKALDETI